jgi:hypothetical protein
LIEEIALEDQPPTTSVVELGEVNDNRFVVYVRTPGLAFVLQVVYRKVKSLAGESPSAADSSPAQPEAQVDIEEMMSTLYALACPMVAHGSFQPVGVSMSNAGDLTVEHVVHGGSGMEVRKQLHRILLKKAASGQVRGVAICHSLQNELGSFLVVGADHARGRPTTILYPLEDSREGTRVSGQQIQQRAAYTFFKFVQPEAARRLLPGRWFKKSGGQNWLTGITYHPDGTFVSTAGGGHWRIELGDFFTQLSEKFDARTHLERVSRFVSLDERRLELSEDVGGLVSSAVYVRYQYVEDNSEKPKRRRWWRFW